MVSSTHTSLTFVHGFQHLLLYSTSASTSTSTVNDSYANYLLHSLGLTQQQAHPISTKLSLRRNKVIDSKFVENANSVVTLFRNLGFHQTHIRKIVIQHPQLLASSVHKTLSPKLKVIQDEGFSRSDIVSVISKCPGILFLRLETTILPAFPIIRQLMVSHSNVVNTVKKLGWCFSHVAECLLPNVALLTGYGIPIELIRKQVVYKPGCYVHNPEVFKNIAMRVEEKLGIPRDSPMFLYGINLICEISEETFESKCRVFKSSGWTQSDVEKFIKKNACCFTISDERLQKKLDFLTNELQLKPAYLIYHNTFITCSLEKRVLPRHKIMLVLKDKGLFQKPPSLYSVILMSEPCFLKRFVLPFKEVHEVYAEHVGCSLKILTQETAHSIL